MLVQVLFYNVLCSVCFIQFPLTINNELALLLHTLYVP